LPSLEKLDEKIIIHRYALSPKYVKQSSRDLTGVVRYSLESLFKLSSLSFDTVIFNQWPLLHILFVEPFVHAKITIIDWCEIWSSGIVNLLQKIISRFPNGHIVVNDSIKLWLTKIFGVPARKVEVIPSAIKIDMYKTELNKKVKGKVVFVGRLSKHKRLDILIEAVKIAHKICPYVRLDIIGDGFCFDEIKELIGERDKEFIKLHGFLKEEEKIEHLKKAWLFGLLSEREGFPKVISEALASGTPVLTSDSPGNHARYLIQKYNVGFVCPLDPLIAARIITQLYKNDSLWVKLAQSSLIASKQFDLKRVIDKLESFINWLIIAC